MGSKRLYVGNLNYQTSEDKLKEVFGAHGEVVSVTIIQGKGFGFVEMDSDEAANKAKEALNNADVDGRNVRVDDARPKREGGGGGGGGGGFRR